MRKSAVQAPQSSYGGVLEHSPEKVQHQLPVGPRCVFCYHPHESVNCKEFLALSAPKRHEEIKKSFLCYKCLTTGHIAKFCEKKFECRKCRKEHIDVLHSDEPIIPPLGAENRGQSYFGGRNSNNNNNNDNNAIEEVNLSENSTT